MNANSLLKHGAALHIWRTRRVRLWTICLAAALLVLVLQGAFPAWQLLPRSAGHLGDFTFLFVFVVALGCEYVDSSLGMGYGTTLTPLLLLLGFEPLQIVPCVLLSEFVSGLTAALMHHRDGNVDFLRDRRARTTVLLLSSLSVVGAVSAVFLALQIPRFWLKAIIAIIILSIGVLTLATFRRKLRYRASHILTVGLVAAFNKGLSGGGYGPLVTSGQVVSGVSSKHAVAITSLAESLTCIVGLIAYMALRGNLDWTLAIPLTSGAILSVPMATLTVRRLPETVLRTSVGVTTCILGLLALAKVVF
jgi:uncharacterized membrane protein YfcA